MGVESAKKTLLSIVITTRNEARNIEKCIHCFDVARRDGWCEVLVVDNQSDDRTYDLATACGVKVINQGPERSAQRNRGWREAQGAFVCFIDADMRMQSDTLDEIKEIISATGHPDALWIREIRVGAGWWIKVRNFERSFYDGTCIDALRVLSRGMLEKIDGFDVNITGFEDWDLDRKVLACGGVTAITKHALLHDEGDFSWKRHLKKKGYYSKFTSVYRDKWHNDDVVRKQLGLCYRFFVVFTENGKWKRALRHPLLMASIFVERFIVGVCWLLRRK